MKYPYAYLMLDVALAVIWIIFYLLLPALKRREMIFVSAWTFPLAVTEITFYDDYFAPEYLFSWLLPPGFALENFLFCWTFGAWAVCWDVFSRQNWKLGAKKHLAMFVWLYSIGTACFFILTLGFKYFTPDVACILLVIIGSIQLAYRPDLVRVALLSAVMGALLFGLCYLVVVIPIYGSQVMHDWYKGTIYILNVPIEEWLFGAAWGYYASVAYKFAVGMRVTK